MNKLTTILMVGAVLGSAGLAIAQAPALFPAQPYDLSHEYYNDLEGAANGLPLATGATDLVLDSKAFVGSPQGTAFAPLGFERGLPLNEWIVPALPGQSDPENPGQRTKSYIAPGLARFHAWYGNWTDKDGDQSVDALNNTDTADEWTGYKATGPSGNHSIKVWVHPGHHPGYTSDYWVLGDFLSDSSFLENNESDYGAQFDFEMLEAGDGNWTGSALILMMENSLVESVTVHTVADGFVRPSQFPYYSCSAPGGGAGPTCRVDVDRYDSLDPIVESLWHDALDATWGTLGATDPIVEPVVDLLNGLPSVNTGSEEFGLSENNATDPYASMTTAHGAPRQPGGYNYADDYHAYANGNMYFYVSEPNAVGYLGGPALGFPAVDAPAKGFAPGFTYAMAAKVGVAKDLDGDGDIGDFSSEVVSVSCKDVIDVATGSPTNITGTIRPVDDAGNSLASWGAAGVYVLREDPDRHVEVAGEEVDDFVIWYDDMLYDFTDLDLEVDAYVTDGSPIGFDMKCDPEDSAEWGSPAWEGSQYYFFPLGTQGFNILMEFDDGIAIRHTLSSGTTVTEAIQDVDFYDSWS